MGRSNQQRRAAKKRRDSRSGERRASGPAGWGWQPGNDPDWLLLSAAESAAEGDTERVAALAGRLTGLPAPRVEAAVTDATASALHSAFEGGWQPAEVVRQVRRKQSATHADLLSTAMAVERWRQQGCVPPAGWTDQLEELGVSRWWGRGDAWLGYWGRRAGIGWSAAVVAAAETLAVLIRLPVIEAVLAPPSQWSASASPAPAGDDPVLARIRALLAKAESTTYPAEADALSAKAQELMARHAVDEALARADGRRDEEPVLRRIPVDDPYAAAKGRLLDVVCASNGVRTVNLSGLGMVSLVGFASDVDAAEVLFTSLLVQASRAMLRRGQVSNADGRSRTRSFRQSFLLAYASRIHERLAAATSVAHHQAETDLDRCLLPVLADRDARVDAAVSAHFPQLVQRSGPRATNAQGWYQGRVAAEMATLGPERATLPGAP